jgi:hypothetical protein
MDVFLWPLFEIFRIRLSVFQDRTQSLLDSDSFLCGQHAGTQQTITVGYAGTHIGGEESAIKVKAPVEMGKALVGFSSEASAPQVSRFAH